eukprot:2748614-Rhodomonas_salina.2
MVKHRNKTVPPPYAAISMDPLRSAKYATKNVAADRVTCAKASWAYLAARLIRQPSRVKVLCPYAYIVIVEDEILLDLNHEIH